MKAGRPSYETVGRRPIPPDEHMIHGIAAELMAILETVSIDGRAIIGTVATPHRDTNGSRFRCTGIHVQLSAWYEKRSGEYAPLTSGIDRHESINA